MIAFNLNVRTLSSRISNSETIGGVLNVFRCQLEHREMLCCVHHELGSITYASKIHLVASASNLNWLWESEKPFSVLAEWIEGDLHLAVVQMERGDLSRLRSRQVSIVDCVKA